MMILKIISTIGILLYGVPFLIGGVQHLLDRYCSKITSAFELLVGVSLLTGCVVMWIVL